MYGLTDTQLKSLDHKIKEDAEDFPGNCNFGKKPEAHPDHTALKSTLDEIKVNYLTKLPNYNAPKKLDSLLLLRFLTLNHWKKSSIRGQYCTKTVKISGGTEASVREILKLENRMYDINTTLAYNEDAPGRLAADVYFNGQDVMEYNRLQELVVDLEDKLSADE